MFRKLILMSLLTVSSFIVYAKEPISLVVPIAAGGGTDILARTIAESMTRNGHPTVVINRPGAERSIGANSVATAQPNGKTLFFGAISDTVLLPLFKYPGLQFNENSFVPIAYLGSIPLVITAKNDFPANNYREFLEVIRKDPSKYPVGSFGKLSVIHAHAVFSVAGVTPSIVNYKGDQPIATDLAGGHLSLGINSISGARAMLADKRIKAIAMLSDDRLEDFPNVGTVKEVSGWTGYAWFGAFAPPGTPRDKVTELHMIFNNALEDPEVKKRMASQGYIFKPKSQAWFEQYYRQQIQLFSSFVERVK